MSSRALAAGYEVIAFVRDPSKLAAIHERLTVVQGDATNAADVERAVEGTDAVISVMATSASQKIAKAKPPTCATCNILAAMDRHGVRRLIISSAGIPQPNDSPDPRFSLLMGFVKLVVRASHHDTLGSAQVVRTSNVADDCTHAGPTNALKTGHVRAGYVDKGAGCESRAPMRPRSW